MRMTFLTLASIFTVFFIIFLSVANVNKIRWDKVPIISYFVLEINLYPAGFDASYLDEPIKWDQLDQAPDDWEQNGSGSWFAINSYTKNLLKDHMRENNLGIVPDSWPKLEITSDFEKCLETFDFVKLGEPNPSKKPIVNLIGASLLFAATIFWTIFLWLIARRCFSRLFSKKKGNK